MTLASILFALAAVGAIAFNSWRLAQDHLRIVVPGDVRLLRTYYLGRGYSVLEATRDGTRKFFSVSIRRDRPIRTYRLELERPDGHRETLLRGVAEGDWGQRYLWRFDDRGEPVQMH